MPSLETLTNSVVPVYAGGAINRNDHRKVSRSRTKISAASFVSPGTRFVDSSGVQGNGFSYMPVINGTGQFVAFVSFSSDLTPDQVTPGGQHVFVHDRTTKTTELVSVDSAFPSLSADGRFVAYANAVGVQDIFIYDRSTGTTQRITNGSYCTWPSISATGNVVAFPCWNDNVVPGDTHQGFDVFAFDAKTMTTGLVSVSSAGLQGEGDSWVWGSGSTFLSANGRYVVFMSGAILAEGVRGQYTEIFIRDRNESKTYWASEGARVQWNALNSSNPSISGNGGVVAFEAGLNAFI